MEIEPEDAVVVDPLDGNLNSDGSALLHFKRSSSLASMGRILCKVQYFLLQGIENNSFYSRKY